MKRLLYRNGLSIILLLSFLLLWIGQSLAGWHEYNEAREDRGARRIHYQEYLKSAHFWEATAENWESEFLQMGVYVLLTVWLVQQGSSESRKLDGANPQDEDPRTRCNEPGVPWPVRRGGWILWIYERSLFLGFFVLFSISVIAHAWSGYLLYNEEQMGHGKNPTDFAGYMSTSRFWFESFQNWQSEFLAVGSIVILSIWLRQRGSPESKRVAAAHSETGE